MKPGKGKAKGGDFERRVCRLLTEWVTGHPKPEIFWRSASSGAKATQESKQGLSSYMGGDIVAVDEQGMFVTSTFSVELKSYKDFDFAALLEHKGKLIDWWSQCVRDAEQAGKEPLLIFKRNRSPLYLACFSNSSAAISTAFHIYSGIHDLKVYKLEEWMMVAKPSKIKRRINDRRKRK